MSTWRPKIPHVFYYSVHFSRFSHLWDQFYIRARNALNHPKMTCIHVCTPGIPESHILLCFAPQIRRFWGAILTKVHRNNPKMIANSTRTKILQCTYVLLVFLNTKFSPFHSTASRFEMHVTVAPNDLRMTLNTEYPAHPHYLKLPPVANVCLFRFMTSHSRNKVSEKCKCTKWPQNNFQPSRVKSTCTLNFYLRGPRFLSVLLYEPPFSKY